MLSGENEKDRQIVELKRQLKAALHDFKASIETDHCEFCINEERCQRKAEKEDTYSVPAKGCGFRWKGLKEQM